MKYLYLLFLVVLFSCTTVKRYKSIDKTGDDTAESVSIDLFGTKVDAAKEDENLKSLWDLQAEGQAELIKELSERNTDDDKFSSALNTKYLKAKEKVTTDYTSKDVRLIFSISKKRNYSELTKPNPAFTLGDRIEYIQFDIIIPETLNLSFVKWNKFTTEYATIDIADVSFNQSLEVTASSGMSSASGLERTIDNEKTTTSGGFTPSLAAKGTTSKTEAQKIRYRYVLLNGKISDKQASIEQEGTREIDLSGNVIADFNLKFAESPETMASVEGYKTSAGAYNTPNKLKVVLYTVLVPLLKDLPETINATLKYQYAYRHVLKGSKTYYEWDDRIEYLKGDKTKSIPLFKKKDYLPGFYNIAKVGEDKLLQDQRTRIMLKDIHSEEETEMIFSSLAAAQEFWSWLIKYEPSSVDVTKPIIIGSFKLLLRSGGINADLSKRTFNAIKSNMEVLPYYR